MNKATPLGRLQVYTGNGKGKTTAAIGLAIRAFGAGLKVYFAQFVKGMEYSEIKALKGLSGGITLAQFGRRCFIRKEPEQADIDMAKEGLAAVAEALKSGLYNVVILDEANIALHFKLFSLDELLQAIEARHPGTEAVVTGRNAPSELIDKADLVTEMREVKHYYTQGVEARDGIER
jgi:cob(I)alamin adenosyltransferase